MKLKIKVKRIDSVQLPEIIKKGDWIDLRCSQSLSFKSPEIVIKDKKKTVKFDFQLFGLGVAMQLPKGFEAVVLPRSSTWRNCGIILCNSQGVIDNSYCGNNDEWKFGAIALRSGVIQAGERVCQFRIQLSQKATIWQKLKWLFCNGIKIQEVNNLCGKNRGGIGSTGTK